MTADRTRFGQNAETLAVRHLRHKGYKIIDRNFRTRRGEIDIVARHRGTLVFVEVKARRSLRFGDPKWAITPAKRRKLSTVALEYLLKTQGTTRVKARFDVVAIQHTPDQPLVEVITNAFELAHP
jgi:putative endonuclease